MTFDQTVNQRFLCTWRTCVNEPKLRHITWIPDRKLAVVVKSYMQIPTSDTGLLRRVTGKRLVEQRSVAASDWVGFVKEQKSLLKCHNAPKKKVRVNIAYVFLSLSHSYNQLHTSSRYKCLFFNGITAFVGYFMLNLSLQKNSSCSWENKGLHTFPKGISPKLSLISRLELLITISSSSCAASTDITDLLSPLLPSFIASGRSSGIHPVSSHSCYMYVRAGRPAFAW